MIVLKLLLCSFVIVNAGPATESYKDQFCTDPRTMMKHKAYSEWADAYSCTRHRCQPGGRNLAIYTVGCKRVEAPESAIECEEVVEDTNMQFPYCCTRLRCLVVVRGEVWTRVLGQPWETLPAAPWSHMYKMKKPPPTDGTFLAKNAGEGPIYELAEAPVENNGGRDKVLRSGKKAASASADCNDTPALRAAPPQTPDIVIALSTSNDVKNDHKKSETGRYTHVRKTGTGGSTYIDDEANEQHNEEAEETPEKPLEQSSDEKFYANDFGVTQKITMKAVANNQGHPAVSWTEIPQNQWNEHELADQESMTHREPPTFHQQDPASHEVEKKEEKPNNLQALVDAIGNRMRDIEHVVQRMSEKVHHAKPGDPENGSSEKRTQPESDSASKHHKESRGSGKDGSGKPKKQSPEGDHYKRFSVHNRGSKYLHTKTDGTTDQPLFVEDTNMNGYFSDASNSVLRRSGTPKEPAMLTYMAPIENRRKSVHPSPSYSEEIEKKRKKHAHKKKKTKSGKSHKKHHAKEDKKKRHKGLNSVEVEKVNVVSLEDSSALVSK